MSTKYDHELQYKLGEETHRTIKYYVIPEISGVNSVADFSRRALQNQASNLAMRASGGMTAKRLITLLNTIRGIKEEMSDEMPVAKIKQETMIESPFTVSIGNEPAQHFGRLTDETTLGTSPAVRCCIFAELHGFVQQTDVLSNWAERAIVKTWIGISNSLQNPLHHLHNVFSRRFVLQRDATQYFIRHDQIAFEDFAEAYEEDFFQTDSHERLLETYGDHVLNSVENLIEEESEITLSPDDTGGDWLESALGGDDTTVTPS